PPAPEPPSESRTARSPSRSPPTSASAAPRCTGSYASIASAPSQNGSDGNTDRRSRPHSRRSAIFVVFSAITTGTPFWAARLAALGTGPRPIRYKRLSAQALAAAIRDAITRPSYRAQAQAMAAGWPSRTARLQSSMRSPALRADRSRAVSQRVFGRTLHGLVRLRLRPASGIEVIRGG